MPEDPVFDPSATAPARLNSGRVRVGVALSLLVGVVAMLALSAGSPKIELTIGTPPPVAAAR
jgi:hypothetical protein